MRVPDWAPWVVAGMSALGGISAWLAALVKGRTDLVSVAQQAAKDVIQDLRTAVDRADERAEQAHVAAEKLRARVSDMEERLLQFNREHEALTRANETLQQTNDDQRRQYQKLVGENDAAQLRIVQLEGELRQKQQVISSLGVVSGDGK